MKIMIVLAVVGFSFFVSGCMAPMVNSGPNSHIVSSVESGMQLPMSFPDPQVERLPLKMSLMNKSREEKALIRRYFHTSGDWPKINYMVIPTPDSQVEHRGGMMVHLLEFDIEADVEVMGWEDATEVLMSVPVDLKQSASNKYSIRAAGSADTMNFVQDSMELVKLNHFRKAVEVLDQSRGELERLAEEYQTYKALN